MPRENHIKNAGQKKRGVRHKNRTEIKGAVVETPVIKKDSIFFMVKTSIPVAGKVMDTQHPVMVQARNQYGRPNTLYDKVKEIIKGDHVEIVGAHDSNGVLTPFEFDNITHTVRIIVKDELQNLNQSE